MASLQTTDLFSGLKSQLQANILDYYMQYIIQIMGTSLFLGFLTENMDTRISRGSSRICEIRNSSSLQAIHAL